MVPLLLKLTLFASVLAQSVCQDQVLNTRCNCTSKFVSVDELVQQIIQNQTTIVSANVSTNPNNLTSESGQARYRLNLIDSFPPDFMSIETRHRGGFVIHLFIFAYLCLALAVIIDCYFLQSLQYFSTIFHISPNISGSTLMALGTSSPEFFTSTISVFVGETTIGTGAIVGSAIFNILAIPGICGLAICMAHSSVGPISSWPIRRDILFYSITVIIFILSIKDNSIDWLESIIFISMYLVYIFCLYLWANFELVTQRNVSQKIDPNSQHLFKFKHYLQQSRLNIKSARKAESTEETNLIEPVSEFLVDNTCIKYSLMPFLVVIHLTVPRATRQTFVLTFVMSCIWIAMLTYFLIWMVSLIGDTFNLSNTIIGMTLLALGNNIPELISSFIVVKRFNLADMAICHTIGSNIFNILICLGLPWFFKILILIITTGSQLGELPDYIIPLEDHLFSYVAISLVVSVIAFNLIFYLNNWKLTVKTSLCCITVYLTSMALILFFPMNINQLR